MAGRPTITLMAAAVVLLFTASKGVSSIECSGKPTCPTVVPPDTSAIEADDLFIPAALPE